MYNKRRKSNGILNRRRGKRFYNSEFTPEQKHRGIILYLYDKGVKDLAKAKNLIQTFHDSQNWNVGKHKFMMNCSVKIQDDFPTFANWLKEQDLSPFVNKK